MQASRFAIVFYILWAFLLNIACAQAMEKPAETKRPPWDTRPPKCFMSAEVMRLSPNCVAEPAWQDFPKTIERVSHLFMHDDYALVAWVENELGFNKEKFPSGEYRFEAFYLALTRQFIGSDSYTEEMIKKWSVAPNSGYMKLAQALNLYNDAWAIRGGGYAKTVSPEAWQLFYSKLAQANEELDKSSPQLKKMGPWYLLKLQIANLHSAHKSSRATLFDEATTAWPDFLPLYTLQMEYAQPKWGGSFDEMEQVALVAHKKTSKQFGAALYARAYERVFIHPDSHTLRDTKVNWKLMKQGFRDIESQKSPAGIWKNFATLACQMRDQKEALRLYELHDRANPDVRESADPCRNFAVSGLIKT